MLKYLIVKSELIASQKINMNQQVTERLLGTGKLMHPKDQQMMEEIENNLKQTCTFKPVIIIFEKIRSFL